MLNRIQVKEIKNDLSNSQFKFLSTILKKENHESLLSFLSENILKKYFEILIKSKNISLFFCEIDNKDIGYMVIANSPNHLINDFKSLKFSIFFDLVLNFKIKVLLNILISFFKLDLIFLSNKKDIIYNNPNLSLLAINAEFQSKGIGKIFIEKVLSEYNFKNRFHQITVETNNLRTENFYKDKVNFVYLGKKLRLFKNLKVFLKDLR
jgi:ribosomal protein S18 acetylase RimI-like enzyme